MIDEGNITFWHYRELTEEFLKCAAICHECLVESDNKGKSYF
jgi:magnesium-transporting ATPase (P-type)